MKNYAGPLSDSDIRKGISTCLEYAKDLRHVVEILMKENEYGLAFVLACVRVEEIAKVSLLKRMRGNQGPEEWKLFWKRFTTHSAKWRESWESAWKELGVTEKSMLDKLIGTKAPMTSAKNSAFYVSYDERLGFLDPRIGFNLELVTFVLELGDDLKRRVRRRGL